MDDSAKKKNLVIGFGSEILSDQGIVSYFIKDLTKKYKELADFRIELINSLDLVNLFALYQKMLVIDTIQDSNKSIGHITYSGIDDQETGIHLENYHDCSIIESIKAARQLGLHVPHKIGIATINVKEIYTLGTTMTQELQVNIPWLKKQFDLLLTNFFSKKEGISIVQ